MIPLPGLYRAQVTDANDPIGRQRVRITSPDPSVPPGLWAEPCCAPGSKTVPPLGATVWIQFEGGRLDRPVWIGVRP